MAATTLQHTDQTTPGEPGGNPLPRSAEVVRAFTTPPPDGGDRMLVVAALLARQHRLRAEALTVVRDMHADDHVVAASARALGACDTARVVLVEQIDLWTAGRLPEARQAALTHTATLGQVVDALAASWTRWRLLEERAGFAGQPTVRMPEVRLALHAVAELSGGYDDLLADLAGGRRRLPVHQTTGPNL